MNATHSLAALAALLRTSTDACKAARITRDAIDSPCSPEWKAAHAAYARVAHERSELVKSARAAHRTALDAEFKSGKVRPEILFAFDGLGVWP